jgi:hypothetical protein
VSKYLLQTIRIVQWMVTVRSVRFQARPRVAKVHRLRKQMRSQQFELRALKMNGETIQRHKKNSAATSSFTDEKERDKD